MNPDLADALQALVAVAIESTVGLEDHTQSAAVADAMRAFRALAPALMVGNGMLPKALQLLRCC